MKRARTIVVEDHAPFRAAIADWLRGMDRAEVVGTFDSDQCTPRALAALRPDLVLLGVGIAAKANLSLVERIKAAASGAKLVVMSFFAVREFEAAVLALGADGFVPKDEVPARLPVLLRRLFADAAPDCAST